MEHLEKLVKSIKARTDAWLTYVKENPSVQGFQSLFTEQELKDATRYVPRCKCIYQKANSFSF